MNFYKNAQDETEVFNRCTIDSILKVFNGQNEENIYNIKMIDFQMRALNILNYIINNNYKLRD